MLDDLLDLFDRKRGHQDDRDGDRGRSGGLRGLLGRLTDEHDDGHRRRPDRGRERRHADDNDWSGDRDAWDDRSADRRATNSRRDQDIFDID